MTWEETRVLMMKRVDGLLEGDEEECLEAHLATCASCREELHDFVDHKEATDLIRERLKYDHALDHYWGGVYNRLEARVGWSLVIIGLSILAGFGLVPLCLDPEVPAWVRIGVGTTGAGSLLLLVHAIRWRLVTGRKDKYTEVIR